MSVKDWDESDEKVEFDKAAEAKAAEEAAAAEKEDAMSEDEKEEVSLVVVNGQFFNNGVTLFNRLITCVTIVSKRWRKEEEKSDDRTTDRRRAS